MIVGPFRGVGNLVGIGCSGENLRQERVGIERDAGDQFIQLLWCVRWRGLSWGLFRWRGGAWSGAWARDGVADHPIRSATARRVVVSFVFGSEPRILFLSLLNK